jgi:hypothetical protein
MELNRLKKLTENGIEKMRIQRRQEWIANGNQIVLFFF